MCRKPSWATVFSQHAVSYQQFHHLFLWASLCTARCQVAEITASDIELTLDISILSFSTAFIAFPRRIRLTVDFLHLTHKLREHVSKIKLVLSNFGRGAGVEIKSNHCPRLFVGKYGPISFDVLEETWKYSPGQDAAACGCWASDQDDFSCGSYKWPPKGCLPFRIALFSFNLTFLLDDFLNAITQMCNFANSSSTFRVTFTPLYPQVWSFTQSLVASPISGEDQSSLQCGGICTTTAECGWNLKQLDLYIHVFSVG